MVTRHMATKVDRRGEYPVFRQVAEILASQIHDGKLSPGSRMYSEEALVNEFEISRMTARAALKYLEDHDMISSRGRRGRFVNNTPDPTAKNDLGRASKAQSIPIAVYPLPERLSGRYFIRAMNGLSRNAVAENVELNYIQASEHKAEGGTLAEFFFKRHIGGIIFLQTNDSVIDQMNELAGAGLPSVAINVNLSGSGLSFVCTDYNKGTTALLSCLFNMGHRRVGYVSLSRNSLSAKEKYQTYRNVIDQYKAEFSPEWVLEFPGEDWDSELSEIGRLFTGKSKPTALLVSTGAPVPYIIRNLAALGIRIPEDVSLVCFDRMKLPAGMPEVTCVEQPVEEAAEIAMNVLLGKMRTGNTEALEIILDPVFLPGNSCRFIHDGSFTRETK